MNAKLVPIADLKIPDYIKRHHSKSQIDKCISSLSKYDQYQPIVISGNEILCGVLVFLSLKKMGRTEVWANDLGDLPIEKKKEIRYLDNQIFDIEDWDEQRIKSYLMELDTSKLDSIGFTQKEAEDFINLEQEVKGKEPKINTIWECESCGWKGEIE